MEIKKFCNGCGEEYIGTLIDYGCPKCMDNFSHRVKGKLFCVCCGKETKRPRRMYCSEECSIIRYQRTDAQKYHLLSLAEHRKKKDSVEMKILYECRCNHLKKENHHFDYSRPLEVIRLCSSCHKMEHRRLRSLVTPALVA